MNDSQEVHIDHSIHRYVDVVFDKTTFTSQSNELKSCIQSKHFRVDYNSKDRSAFSPYHDCLYYPSVSSSKCSHEFDANDWLKLEAEISNDPNCELPTYEIYRLRRLNFELTYFLKMAFHSIRFPGFLPLTNGFEYFVNQYLFIEEHFPEQRLVQEYKNYWLQVLENLKTDGTVKTLLDDGKFYPIGILFRNQIDWLQSRIQL